MASIWKQRARKVLAQGPANFGRVTYPESGERFVVGIYDSDEDRTFRVEFQRPEAIAFAADIASHITFDASKGTVDRRSFSEQLRALADHIDRK